MTGGEEGGRGRVAAVRAMDVLDTPPEPEFDALVREAAASIGAPIALVSLLDEDRQWFKARVGLAPRETPIASSFCLHAVRGCADVFEVPDARRDERFAANPLVTGAPGVRFYAGVPLKADGHRVGTLCVIDDKPRRALSRAERDALTALTAKTAALLEARRARRAGGPPP